MEWTVCPREFKYQTKIKMQRKREREVEREKVGERGREVRLDGDYWEVR